MSAQSQHPKPTADPDLITGEELAARLSITLRQLGELRRRRIASYVKLGHRTIRYSLKRTLDALIRLEVRPVGDKR